MIRLLELELLHWDVQAHQRLQLSDGVTLMTGENGSGKTSVLDAIKVALGARKLGGDRSIDGYLRRQNASVAMVRLLLDNKPQPGDRRRPFDALGAYGQDIVTLAVVFERDDDEHRRSYFLADGDVVPLDASTRQGSRRDRPGSLSASDYRRRLERVGITARYLRLLCLPQGRIASFCSRDADALFDDLFDIIGGRDALLEWEARVREVRGQEADLARAKDDLAGARKNLRQLGRLAERYREYAQTARRWTAATLALPHARRQQAQRQRDGLLESVTRADESLRRCQAEVDAAEAGQLQARAESEQLDASLKRLDGDLSAHEERLREGLRRHAEAKARVGHLELLKSEAEGIEPVAIDAIDRREQGIHVRLGEVAGRTLTLQASVERDDEELANLRAGLLAWPEDVESFRVVLQQAQIVFHLLAQVIDIRDPGLATAYEGWLGRYRFAVLLQDPTQFDEAAALARQHGYRHGVMAPDVRGHSPADEQSALTGIEVREARYRPLVARLLRRVRVDEPARPFTPPRRVELLAADGFNLTRLDARVVRADKHYLGMAARKRREAQLLSALAETRAELKALALTRGKLEAEVTACRAERERQLIRSRWEAARDGWSEAHAHERELAGRVAAAEASVSRLRAQVGQAREKRGELRQLTADATQRLRAAEKAATKADTELANAKQELARADSNLGRLLAEEVPELDSDAQEVLATAVSYEVLQAQAQGWREQLDRYPADERDPNLPMNHERQQHEVEAVARNIEELRERLDGTRKAAEHAHDQYRLATRRVFRAYFGRLRLAARGLDYTIEGTLDRRGDGRFSCAIRVGIQDKPLVHHDSEALSGGQKAALSILMAMTAVSLETDSAGFFLIDEPFSASDATKINELGRFLQRTGAQYLLSMPTSADLQHCGAWLRAVWLCTRTPGGYRADGTARLAPPVQVLFAHQPEAAGDPA